VTTIRVTRRPPAAVSETAPPEPDHLRLALIEPRSPRTSLDGAWWPHTSDLSEELPALRTAAAAFTSATGPDNRRTATEVLAATTAG